MKDKLKRDICCVGHITLDKIITPDNVFYMNGGTAYYFAYGINHLPHQVSFKLVTAMADRDQRAVSDMRHAGIEVDCHESRHTVFFENKYGKNMNNRTCVLLDNEATIEFDKDGHWMIVDCRKSSVPMRMVPGKIQMILSKSHPGADVVYMGREIKNGDITILLNDGTELHFTNEHTLIQ